MYYSDKLTVNFSPRTVWDKQMAENLNMLAEFDYDEMDMDIMNYYNQWDRLFFGVWIRIMVWWDDYTKTPVFKNIDPLSWYPDPEWWQQAFRYHGFEVDLCRSELTADDGYFNVKDLKKSPSTDEKQLTLEAYREASGLQEEVGNEQMITVLNQYTYLNGKPYLVTLADNMSRIIRLVEIEPTGDEEKNSPDFIKLPVVLNYYSPQRNNPYWVSIGDLVEDKQRAKSILANLRLKKEKAELYPMYLYNTTKIRNRRDLDFGFNKLIAVNWPVDQWIVQPLQKDFNKAMTFNVEQSIDAEAQIATWASTIQQWVTSEDQRTLGEIQQVQSNANLRFLLGSRVNSWGDKFFWRLWYRQYKKNFKKTQEKIIRINNGFGIKPAVLQRKDFITIEDPDIEIKSRIESLNKKERDRISYMQVYPLFASDPDMPKVSKNFAKREMLRVSGIDAEKINVLVPQSPEEYSAYQENELIKRNQLPTALPQEDHLTHIFVHQQEEQTNANKVHQETHWQLYKDQMMQQNMAMQQMQQGQEEWAMRQASNISQWQIWQMAAQQQERWPQELINQ